MKDRYRRPHEAEITDEAKAWVVSIACTKPKDHGPAAELWTISVLANFVAERAEDAGFARLANAGKSTVWRILDDNKIKPHKIRYCLEKRDPDFDRKMQKYSRLRKHRFLKTEVRVCPRGGGLVDPPGLLGSPDRQPRPAAPSSSASSRRLRSARATLPAALLPLERTDRVRTRLVRGC